MELISTGQETNLTAEELSWTAKKFNLTPKDTILYG